MTELVGATSPGVISIQAPGFGGTDILETH